MAESNNNGDDKLPGQAEQGHPPIFSKKRKTTQRSKKAPRKGGIETSKEASKPLSIEEKEVAANLPQSDLSQLAFRGKPFKQPETPPMASPVPEAQPEVPADGLVALKVSTLTRLSRVTPRSGGHEDVASARNEAALHAREARLTEREADLMRREADLAKREEAFALRERVLLGQIDAIQRSHDEKSRRSAEAEQMLKQQIEQAKEVFGRALRQEE